MKKQLTDKRGTQTTRWIRANPNQPKQPVAGARVGFENGEHKGHGEVVAAGKDGATIKDGAGGVHRVPHAAITHHWEGEGAPDHSPHEARPHEGDADSFSASEYAKQHDDPHATAESIVAGFGEEGKKRAQEARDRLGGVKQTVEQHKEGDDWTPERRALQQKVIFDGVEIKGKDGKMKKVPGLLALERIKAATPPPGQRPTFITLGGRGGSGKSSLNGRVYEESRAIVLDADHIKGMLPEYEGWNAHQVHEESSEILETVLTMARLLGVNVVLDATMKTGSSIEQKIDAFKESGFRTEAHYMHLPRQEAAKRGFKRFLDGGKNGRYVPPEVILGNNKNEENFDKIKDRLDAWSFHDNSGSREEGPKLIASKGEPGTVSKKIMTKSHALTKNEPYIIFVAVKGGAE